MLIERLIIGIFKVLVYRSYKKKYKLPASFRFNGYFIRIAGDGDIVAGENSYISFFSYINVRKGTELTIGSKVSISHNVKIYTSSFDAEELIRTGANVPVLGRVNIGSNVVIGANCFINPNVSIGDNVVIGANSVITGDIESNCVAAGAPARVIKRYV